MSKRSLPLTILFFLLLLPACRKDELTLPAKVIFKFELIPHQEADNLKGGPPFDVPGGRMTIDRGTLKIKSIEFEGRRDEGRDVFFESDFPDQLDVNLETGETSHELSFDIPQGIYNRVDLLLELGDDERATMVLEGNIKKGASDKIPLRFEYNIRDRIRVRAESGSGSNKIVLRKDTPSTARIVLDAGMVFQFVKPGVLQNASISVFDQKEMILINRQINRDLFILLDINLRESFRVIID